MKRIKKRRKEILKSTVINMRKDRRRTGSNGGQAPSSLSVDKSVVRQLK